MRKIILYIATSILFFSFAQMHAQNTTGSIHIENFNVTKENNKAVITMDVNLDSLEIKSVEMVTLTPKIESEDGLISKSFSPIVIVGGNKEKTLNRSIKLNGFEFENTPQLITRHKNNQAQNIPLSIELPYAEWLHHANLYFDMEINGCACHLEGKNKIPVEHSIFPPVYNPTFNVCYVTPPAEEVKVRSDKYTAHLNFKVAKYDLLHDFGDNAKILEEVNNIITEIRNDPNLKVTEFHVEGYASPEGNSGSNMVLSKNRAYAFVNYLKERYGIDPKMIKTSWYGEDWRGLRTMVESSAIIDKSKILNIIDNDYKIDDRKIELKKLSGGSTYQKLLQDFYPSLRRNEYTISYVAKPFTLEEAKKIIKTKPQQLSLNEMFMVANSYSKNDPEFKRVFDIMEKYYPNNSTVKANVAAVDLENGNWDAAIRQYESIKESIPEIWNNLGYAYFQKQDYKKAEEYFRKASAANLDCANKNLSEFEKWSSFAFK